METKLYVGNLAFDITEDHLRNPFTQAGKVNDVSLVKNHGTGSSKGYGFVIMSSQEDGNKAIEQFHGRSIGYRELVVNVDQIK